jgi:hypothetical protein
MHLEGHGSAHLLSLFIFRRRTSGVLTSTLNRSQSGTKALSAIPKSPTITSSGCVIAASEQVCLRSG